MWQIYMYCTKQWNISYIFFYLLLSLLHPSSHSCHFYRDCGVRAKYAHPSSHSCHFYRDCGVRAKYACTGIHVSVKSGVGGGGWMSGVLWNQNLFKFFCLQGLESLLQLAIQITLSRPHSTQSVRNAFNFQIMFEEVSTNMQQSWTTLHKTSKFSTLMLCSVAIALV